jgi:hypothetical protein
MNLHLKVSFCHVPLNEYRLSWPPAAPKCFARNILGQSLAWKSRGKSFGDIKKSAAEAIFRLYDPKIRVEADFAGKFGVRLRGSDPGVAMEPREKPLVSIFHLALRRRPKESRGAVEPVDLDKNRAGFRSASPAQHGTGAFMRAAPQIGRDPNISAQPHAYDRLLRGTRRFAGTSAAPAAPIREPPGRVNRTNAMRASASRIAAGGPAMGCNELLGRGGDMIKHEHFSRRRGVKRHARFFARRSGAGGASA